MANTPLPFIKSGVHGAVNGEVGRHHTAVTVPGGIRCCAAFQGPHAVTVTEVGQGTLQAAAMLIVRGKIAALGDSQSCAQVGNPLTVIADGKLDELPILLYPEKDFSRFVDRQGSRNCVVQQLRKSLGQGGVVSANSGKQGGAAGGVM